MVTEVTDDASTSDAAKAAAADTAQAVNDQAKAVASTASDQVQEVVGQAKEQAASVASEARAQAQHVLSTATSELSTQLDQRLSTATGAARTTSEELRALAEGRHEDAGRAGDLAHEASQRLAQLADRVDELGARGVTEEVADFARRRPVAFLLGAATAGLLVGHLARAGKEASARTNAAPQTSPSGGEGDLRTLPAAPSSVAMPLPDRQVPSAHHLAPTAPSMSGQAF